MTTNNKTIGQNLSPILEEIESALWEYEAQELGKPGFTDAGFRAAIKIFMAVLMEKMWLYQQGSAMSQEERVKQAAWLGSEINKLVKHVTGIDTKKLY